MFVLKRAQIPNLGDSINDNLIGYITKQPFIVVNHRFKNAHNKPILIAVGSILQWADNNTMVWGSGFISAKSAIHTRPKHIAAVRGPLSRERLLQLGYACPEVYGDPALLYPRYYKPNVSKKYKLGVIAHYIDRHSPLMQRLKGPDVLDIYVKQPVNISIEQICSCDYIVSSSLHGVILADAYGVPAIWIKITDKVIGAGFKFRDYFLSVGRPEQVPVQITDTTTIKDLLNSFYKYKIDIDLDRLLKVCPV